MLLNAILIPPYGVQGAAIATAVSYITSWGIRMAVSRRYIKMKLHFIKDLIAYVLLFVQMVLALSETHLYAGQVLLLLCLIGMYFKNYREAVTQLVKGAGKT